MSKMVAIVGSLLLSMCQPHALEATELQALEIQLVLEPSSLHVGQYPKVDARILNSGSQPVVLVEPGDGSDVSWRTPIIHWQVRLVTDAGEKDVLQDGGSGCGNINALRADEVFQLNPGQTRKLSGLVDMRSFTKPGIYRVRLYYENRPELQWSGLPLGPHDQAAMARVRTSTPCVLLSNEVTVEVTE